MCGQCKPIHGCSQVTRDLKSEMQMLQATLCTCIILLANSLTHGRRRCRGPLPNAPFPQNGGKQSRLRDRAQLLFRSAPANTCKSGGMEGQQCAPTYLAEPEPLPSLSPSLPSTGAISSLSRARPSAQLHCTQHTAHFQHLAGPTLSHPAPVRSVLCTCRLADFSSGAHHLSLAPRAPTDRLRNRSNASAQHSKQAAAPEQNFRARQNTPSRQHQPKQPPDIPSQNHPKQRVFIPENCVNHSFMI